MKKIMVALLMAVLISGGAFAGEGFGVTAQVEGSIFTTTVGNGTTDAGFFKGLDSGAGDFELAFSYSDLDDLYGANLTLEAGGDAVKTTDGNALIPVIKNANAWVKFANIIKVTAGKGFDYRAIGKVDGEKDFGVQGFDEKLLMDYTKEEDLTTTDPFKFGSGLLVNVLVGPVDVGLFAGPSQGYSAWDYNDDGKYEFEDTPYWNGDARLKQKFDLFNYEYGLSVGFKHEIVDAALVFKMSRAEAESFGAPVGGHWNPDTDFSDAVATDIVGYTSNGAPIYAITFTDSDGNGWVAATSTPYNGSWGKQAIDLGLYAQIKAIDGLTIGVGYAGHKDWTDQKKDAGKHDPFKSGINLDAKLVLGPFTAGLYNNISFWSVAEDKDAGVRGYQAFYLYDQLSLAYALTEKLTADLRVQNFLETITAKGSDDKTYAQTVDKLAIRAGVEYQVVPDKAKAWARVQFKNTAYSAAPENKNWTNTGYSSTSDGVSRNHFTFDIPVGVQVKF